MGSARRLISKAEKKKMPKMRRSIVTSRELKKGTTIREEDLLFKRPGTGIEPDKEQIVVGRKVNHDLPADAVLRWKDLE
jgi:N,N'-diacetyllegionaminate synthase